MEEQRFIEDGFNLTILSRIGSRIVSRNLKETPPPVLVESKRAPMRKLDKVSRNPVRISSGKRTRTVTQLKMSCRMAAAKPRRYICMSLMLYKATMVEVRLVPMLVPMMMGMPCFTVSALEATRVTTREVVADEDCKNRLNLISKDVVRKKNLEEGGGENAKGETEHWTVVQVARVEKRVVRNLE